MKFKGTDIKQIEPLKKVKKGHKLLITKIVVIFILVGFSAYGVFSFLNTYTFQNPLIVRSPIIKKDTDRLISPVAKGKKTGFNIIPQAFAQDLTDEQYICQKFGNHCKIAVAIAKAESGLDAKKVNPRNSDGSVDFGCWQINSVHLKKASNAIEAGKLLETFMDCKKATDWVFDNIYQDQGFQPWVAYTSGAYLAKL